jgi:hypothetical protein
MIARNEHTFLLVLHLSVLIPWENRHCLYYHKNSFNASKPQSHYSVTLFNSQNFSKKRYFASGVQQTGFLVDVASSAAQETRVFQYHKKREAENERETKKRLTEEERNTKRKAKIKEYKKDKIKQEEGSIEINASRFYREVRLRFLCWKDQELRG